MRNHHKRKGTSLKNKEAHNTDHKNWSRRSFLSSIGMLASGSLLFDSLTTPSLLTNPLLPLINSSSSDNILLIIRLKGGNDSLNMVVPAGQYSLYQSVRPTINIPQSDLYDLGSGWSLPDYMINPTESYTNLSNLNTMWNNGSMAVLHSVGYPNMDESHFGGERNWSTASGGGIDLPTGWMGRHLNEIYPDYLENIPEVPPAIHIGANTDLMFESGTGNISYLIQSIEALNQIVTNGDLYDVQNLPECLYGSELGFVRAVANSTQSQTTSIKDAYDASTDQVTYPGTVNWENRYMGEKLRTIARLIKGNLGTKIFMVDMDGYDTHNQQTVSHQHLMEDLAEAISAFYNDLELAGLADKVLTMTISEFGRNIRENGSSGTDHGNAGAMLMFGQGLSTGGFYSTPLDLSSVDLTNHDIAVPYQLDYRDVYYTVLKNWLCVDASLLQLLMGASYNEVPNLILNCDEQNSCPTNEVLGNQNLNGTQSHQSTQLTSSSGTVSNGADIELKSEGTVKLENGFTVEQGAELKVRIADCDN